MSRAFRSLDEARISLDELHLPTDGPTIEQRSLPEPACWRRRLELRLDALPSDVQDALRGVTQRHSYAPGEPIFRRGERPLGLYRIDAGVVKVTRRMPDGPEALILGLRNRGESLGEETLFHDAPHGASAWALQDVDLTLVPRAELWAVMRDCPEFLEQLLAIYAARVQLAQNKLTMFYFENVETRLATAVLDLAHRFGQSRDGAVHIPLPLHPWDWAQFVGARVETVSRVFARWTQHGWIRRRAGALVIEDGAGLITCLEQPAHAVSF